MPRTISFGLHPEGHAVEVHDYYLLKRMMYPSDILHEKLERGGDSIFNYSFVERDRIAAYHGGLMPLAFWLSENASIIEGRAKEKFSWTFERFYWCYDGDEESETAFGISLPVWIATARDFEGSIVCKNWTIAFDEMFGDFHCMRGEFSYKKFFEESRFTEREKNIRKVVDVIREFQRIRNFRLVRTGVPLPE